MQTPFVAVNCAAIPAEMFEAELFGAERGAYTGANKKRPGLVTAAQGGTLFLDETTEVPIALQAKLLRFLEGGGFRALGGTATDRFTGRLVAATNKSLRSEVQAGRFREDLLVMRCCVPGEVAGAACRKQLTCSRLGTGAFGNGPAAPFLERAQLLLRPPQQVWYGSGYDRGLFR